MWNRRVALRQLRDAGDETRPCDAQLHRRGIVAVDAADGMRTGQRLETLRLPIEDGILGAGLHDFCVRVPVRAPAERDEARHHVAATEAAVRRNHRRVTVQTRTRLRPLGTRRSAPGLSMRMAAPANRSRRHTANMRVSHGSLEPERVGDPSLPPYRVCVASTVRR
jgi:hypothetical protein